MGLSGKITPTGSGGTKVKFGSRRATSGKAERERADDERVKPQGDHGGKRAAEPERKEKLSPLDAAREVFSADVRDLLALAGRRYALVARSGEAGIRDLLKLSDEHHQRGDVRSIHQLLDEAERNARENLRGAREAVIAVEDSPTARHERALKVVSAALTRSKESEQRRNPEHDTARKNTEAADRRARTLAAIENARSTR